MSGNTMITAATEGSRLLLAHQGGWDEVMLVGIPVVLFGGLLLVARQRARQIVAQRDIEAKADPDS